MTYACLIRVFHFFCFMYSIVGVIPWANYLTEMLIRQVEVNILSCRGRDDRYWIVIVRL